MRTTVTKEVTKVESVTVSDTVTCDICGVAASSPRPICYDSTVDWDDDWYSYDRITISRCAGHAYPEGGADKTTSYHVCPDCWPKLAAWIESHRGAKATEEESDF